VRIDETLSQAHELTTVAEFICEIRGPISASGNCQRKGLTAGYGLDRG